MVRPIACIDFLEMPNGEPGVRLSATVKFMEMDVIEKCIYIAAAAQLCGASIDALCDDHPDIADEIRQRFVDISITPSPRGMN